MRLTDINVESANIHDDKFIVLTESIDTKKKV